MTMATTGQGRCFCARHHTEHFTGMFSLIPRHSPQRSLLSFPSPIPTRPQGTRAARVKPHGHDHIQSPWGASPAFEAGLPHPTAGLWPLDGTSVPEGCRSRFSQGPTALTLQVRETGQAGPVRGCASILSKQRVPSPHGRHATEQPRGAPWPRNRAEDGRKDIVSPS